MTIEIEYTLPVENAKPKLSQTFYQWRSAEAFVRRVLEKFPKAEIVYHTD